MEENMKIQKILAAASALLLVTFVIQVWLNYNSRPGTVMMAEWRDKPATLQAAYQLADEVVTGRVVKIRRAADLVAKAPKSEADIRIPVEVVTIEVETKLKGQKRGKKEIIELFHTGLSNTPSLANKRPPDEKPPPKPKDAIPRNKAPRFSPAESQDAYAMMLHGDPAYKVGERYTLFVRTGPKLKVKGRAVATQAIISPEGRYRLSKSNKLEPLSNLGFAGKLKAKKLDVLKSQISSIQTKIDKNKLRDR
jgi:hypothetical protein